MPKVCKHCKQPHPTVYGGRYPRHVCQPCKVSRALAHEESELRDPTTVYQTLRAIVYAKANGLCALCGVHCLFEKADRYDRRPNLAEIDHIVPRAAGGGRGSTNLQLLCRRCNRAKGARQ
jgi:hypothetical protein